LELLNRSPSSHAFSSNKEYVAGAGPPATPGDLESHKILVFGGRVETSSTRKRASWSGSGT